MPRVSVLIPAYNPGAYLNAAVQSVINQTYTDWEIVLVDDGSTEPLSDFLPPHSEAKINLIRQPHQGQSAARNVGILSSDSEFIALLDADDLWKPTKLQRQIEALCNQLDVGLCFTEFEIIDSNARQIASSRPVNRTSYLSLLENGAFHTSTVMIRRSSLGTSGYFDTLLGACEDFDLWLKIAKRAKFLHLPSVEASYRKHESNMTNDYWRLYFWEKEIYRRHIILAREQQDQTTLKSVRVGLRRMNNSTSFIAFARCIEAFRARKFLFLLHAARALLLSPSAVARSVIAGLVKLIPSIS
jgi:glycosyltransferase involved in cell wall biosynthesis